MFPFLLQLGPLTISSYGVFLAMSFLSLCYLVWRKGRDRGIVEEKIFDNVLILVGIALIGSRAFFVLTHLDLFTTNLLRVFLIWIYPGMSLIGAILAGFVTLFLYTKKQRLAFDLLLDCYGYALPLVMFFISIGVFLDGSITGRETLFITGMPAVGVTGLRHPVALYGAVVSFIFFIVVAFVSRTQLRQLIPKGLIGWMSFSTFALVNFLLAFFRADLIYLDGFSVVHSIWGILFIATLIPIFILVDGISLIKKFIKLTQEKVKMLKV